MPKIRRRATSDRSSKITKQRKRSTQRKPASRKTLQRRMPFHRKRLAQANIEWAGSGQQFNDGYNAGFAKGFEEGHQTAYEQSS